MPGGPVGEAVERARRSWRVTGCGGRPVPASRSSVQRLASERGVRGVVPNPFVCRSVDGRVSSLLGACCRRGPALLGGPIARSVTAARDPLPVGSHSVGAG